MTKKKVGMMFIIISVAFFLIDSLLEAPISTILGEMFCGSHYMQPVNGIVGDVSCGFNADIYFVVFNLTVLLIGITLVITAKTKKT